jgi:poly-gamma-glutamate synthesis protein (capsule biosynthesis protein)
MFRLMLCGDVMTGRGIDQILPHPSDLRLHEPWVKSADEYVRLAEAVNGPIPRSVAASYVWGDALGVMSRSHLDARVINLETAVTTAQGPWPKGINYRMHPDNVSCLTAAGVDCCILANNHVMDWGREGLIETLEGLHGAGIRTCGAGRDRAEAAAPAVLPVPGRGRLLVYAGACPSSGVPPGWVARAHRAGVNVLSETAATTVPTVAEWVRSEKRADDVVVCSLHWGSNWGYAIPAEQRILARALIDNAAVDVVFGHSSHHPKAVELYRRRPIFYGCGDFLNDYEGIRTDAAFRSDLVLMYLVDIDSVDGLRGLQMIPFRIRNFRLVEAGREEREWLRAAMNRECEPFGGAITAGDAGLVANFGVFPAD